MISKNLYSIILEGKRHDAAMLMMSDLYPQLEMHSHDTNGNPLAIYGDPAYPHRVHLQSPYRGANLTDAQRQFNKSMHEFRKNFCGMAIRRNNNIFCF